jgi:formylglycine-generating enzyme required for sulfatase activity
MARGIPPLWASGWGQDEYAPWVSIMIGEASQRLRWIPPGRFLMGSPEDEEGRYEDEGPQHEVTIERGFWMFDTPCTQELWEAVMRDNPSKFRSPNRPVERVSWHECQDFVSRLNDRLEGLELSLPSEAQWEFACRAGTTTATYAGDLTILGISNAPVLDGIAWYSGNCGVDFDLPEGENTSVWGEKQYDFERGGTRTVGQKQPNAWGLHDMLGDVWEWCADKDRSHGGGVDQASAGRILRGGSWSNLARLVRAARRSWYEPSNQNDLIGFRCAEFREGVRASLIEP